MNGPPLPPSTFRTSILCALSSVDSIKGPAVLDLAPFQVTVMVRTWSGGRPDRGSFTDGDGHGGPPLNLSPSTSVVVVNERDVATSGGRVEHGDMKIGPIRPHFVNLVTGTPGGFTPQQLDPRSLLTESQELIYRLTQRYPEGTGESGEYTLIVLHKEDPLAFMAVVRRRASPPSGDIEPGEHGFLPPNVYPFLPNAGSSGNNQ